MPPMLHSNLCTPHYMKTILDQYQFIVEGYTHMRELVLNKITNNIVHNMYMPSMSTLTRRDVCHVTAGLPLDYCLLLNCEPTCISAIYDNRLTGKKQLTAPLNTIYVHTCM